MIAFLRAHLIDLGFAIMAATRAVLQPGPDGQPPLDSAGDLALIVGAVVLVVRLIFDFLDRRRDASADAEQSRRLFDLLERLLAEKEKP